MANTHYMPGGKMWTDTEVSVGDVTVVIPTHNRKALLKRTLASVFEQEPRPARVIVVDDGSTDGTAAMLADEPVTVVRNDGKPWGPARARHEALDQVESEFVAFLDSDDLLLPGALRTLAAALRGHRYAPFAFGRALTARESGAGWEATGLMSAGRAEMREPLPALFARNFVPSVGTLARTSSVRRIGGYPQQTDFSQDHYFWLRLAQLGDPVFVPTITSIYREHDGNRHTPVRAGRELEAYLALAGTDPRLSEAIPRHLGVSFCNAFTYSVRQGDRQTALNVFSRNVLRRRHRGRIIVGAIRHWHDRRQWSEAGRRTLESSVELRDWLSAV
jgi:glycosyltransferase involved in cell wall biosynthesis